MIALFRHLVESSAFAILFLIAVACLDRRRASIRHALLFCAALKFALPLQWLIRLGARLRTLMPSTAIPDLLSDNLHGMWTPLPPDAPSASGTLLNAVFISIWLTIAALLLIAWLRRLSSPIDLLGEVPTTVVLALARAKVPMGVTRNISIKSSNADLEPRLCGLFRPTIVVPANLSMHLTAEEINAVCLHELAHVRRWDNLTRAAAHALTCIFWFFPLLAWLERRISVECELACDELVLACGAKRQEYLEVILKVCRLYVLQPVAGSSNFSGSNFQRRMEYIMSSPIIKTRKVSASIVAGSLFSFMAAALLLTGFLSSTPSRGQTLAVSAAANPRVTCLAKGVEYAEGTVIRLGDGPEQMCVQLREHPQWVGTSDLARKRSANLVSLPAPAAFLCTPTAPAGNYCSCKVQGRFSPGAVVVSAKGPLVCAASGGNWRPYSR